MIQFSQFLKPDITPDVWVALGVTLFLLVISGFMSSSEVAFFSLSNKDLDQVKEQETSEDRSLFALLSDSERLLATILIGNNMVNVAIVILLNYAFIGIFDFSSSPTLTFLLQTVVLTMILLLFGEIIPKVYAQRRPLSFSRFAAPKMQIVARVLTPFSSLLMYSTSIVTRRVQQKKYDLSMEDLRGAVDLLPDTKSDEKTMVEEIINFYDKTASEIMTPRVDMITIDYGWDFHKMLNFAIDCGYSRIPVFEESQDNIRGVLYIKDLILHKDKEPDFDWQSLIRKAYFVPENKPLDDLLEELRSNRIHIAIVVDEYGGTSGLVTMEDILEEIVGEISDEYDETELPYTKLADGSFLFEAKTPLTDVLRFLDLEIGTFGKYEEQVDTLGGLFLEIKQDLPRLGDVVRSGGWSLKVTKVEKFRIIEIQLRPDTPEVL